MAVEHAPVGNTPKLFAMVSQRLDDRQRGVFSIPTSPPVEETESLDQEIREVETSGLKRRLIQETRNLNMMLEEAATYGSRTSAPLKLQNDIEQKETTIAEIKEQLADRETN
jgi:hypothetical protein